MTVGELARKAGVTVRTIQYYDQKGLLTPSAKGPQGQRLYTGDDLEGLYRILTLKYLGLSLSDIAQIPDTIPPAMFRALVGKSQQRLEQELASLLVRMSTLRALEGASEGEMCWSRLSAVIDGAGADEARTDTTHPKATGAVSEASSEDEAPQSKVDSWHHIIDKTIELMNAHVPADSPEAAALAESFLAADGKGMPTEGEFLQIQGSMPESHRRGDFGIMVSKVFEYLHSAAAQRKGSSPAGSGVATVHAAGFSSSSNPQEGEQDNASSPSCPREGE